MSFSLGGGFRSVFPAFTRSLQNKALNRPVPAPRGSIGTPEDFLKAIGRSAETKVQYESWEDLWRASGLEMRKAGIPVKDRRYIMWSMEKYRQGQDPSDFAYEAKGKKKIRGWGPAVQNGKRIRSRRHQ
ncbi:hypothetical protein EVG20_g4363 [Dentipellis fragilis]|uniref:Small ribosomal subunit protein mS41 n=1 Tax=Dentipellis fragilis TaxID=205917 RepID=A0A4Y9Z030_9AGAM|nr:hypothetical protein EVG20_g4363 [Dentipellis fragilis]